MSKENTVSIGLPFILGCLLLGSLGFCGTDCQNDIHAGIRQTVAAFKE